MTKEQLDALRGHTPGQWWFTLEGRSNYMKLYFPEKYTGVSGDVVRGYVGETNARLIASAPDLLAHIDEQQAEIDKLRRHAEALTTGCDRLIDALKQIDRLDHTHSATNCPAYYAGLIARKALDAYRAAYPRED